MATPKTFFLVYQGGIANVFDGQARIFQGDFRGAEMLCRGAILSGAVKVRVRHCERAGDIALWRNEWERGAGSLFIESKRPPLAAMRNAGGGLI
jgi:hypothetical protein